MKIIFLFLLFISVKSFGASCCGGGAALPSLIVSDWVKAQFNSSLSHSSVIGDVDEKKTSTWRNDQNIEIRQTLNFDYAQLVMDDFWQAGISLPIVRKHRELGSRSESTFSVSDPTIRGGFELISDTQYNQINLPKTYIFSEFTKALSRSVYNPATKLETDTTGLGQDQASIGVASFYLRPTYDLVFMLKYSHNFSKQINAQFVDNRSLYQLLFGAGYSIGNHRAGFTINPHINQGKRVTVNGILNNAVQEKFVDFSISYSYLLKDSMSLSVSYSDQTIFPPAQNTTLSRAIALALVYRFEK